MRAFVSSRFLRIIAGLAVIALLVTLQAVASVGTASTARASITPGFTDSVVISGLNGPTVVQFASDGSIVVAEKGGQILSYDSLTDTSPMLVADLSSEVNAFGDRGLLGMALPPDYPADNHIYVLYTRDAPPGGDTPTWNDNCPTPPGPTTDGCVVTGRLSRLTISNGVSVDEHPLIDDWCQQFPSHSVGTLAFGKDGYLYVSGGDGANYGAVDYGQFGGQYPGDSANPCGDAPGPVGTALTPPTAEGGALRAQSIRFNDDATVLNGTVLRIDPSTGEGAPGNPYASDGNANRRRILAWGLRNPFRLTTQPGTNALWIGDVGWNQSDEIDRVPDTTSGNAQNFGWPCYEGNAIQASYQSAGLNGCTSLYNTPGSTTAPYFAYDHASKVTPNEPCPAGGSSLSGLAFYSGDSYPAQYKNALFFADHTRNCLWAMLPDAQGNPDPRNIVNVGQVAYPVDLIAGPASMNNDLFYVAIDTGQIHRLSYVSGNSGPVAVPKITPTNGPAPLVVHYDATASTDPGGAQLSYLWNFGDGKTSTTATGKHTYSKAGTYTATLTVSDPQGLTDLASVPMLAGAHITQMVVQVKSPTGVVRGKYRVGDSLTFSASAVDTTGAAIPASDFSWHLSIHHCYTTTNCHTHDAGTIAGVQSGTFIAPDHDYPCYLTVELTVSLPDSSNTLTRSIRVNPQTVTLRFAANPSTAKLTLSTDAFTGPTPFTQTFVVGHLLSVAAPLQQTVAGHSYTWQRWSDGKAAAHTVVAPAIARTYTATYKRTS